MWRLIGQADPEITCPNLFLKIVQASWAIIIEKRLLLSTEGDCRFLGSPSLFMICRIFSVVYVPDILGWTTLQIPMMLLAATEKANFKRGTHNCTLSYMWYNVYAHRIFFKPYLCGHRNNSLLPNN